MVAIISLISLILILLITDVVSITDNSSLSNLDIVRQTEIYTTFYVDFQSQR
jgi:hypothetical protein